MGELNKMETKPMLPLIVTMSVPPLISMFLQYTYNFVDCMFVSWLSEDALTAVSLAFPDHHAYGRHVHRTRSVGVNVLIARYLGQKNQDMARQRGLKRNHSLRLHAALIVTIVVLLIMKPFFASFTDDPCHIRYGGGLYEDLRVYGGCPAWCTSASRRVFTGHGAT